MAVIHSCKAISAAVRTDLLRDALTCWGAGNRARAIKLLRCAGESISFNTVRYCLTKGGLSIFVPARVLHTAVNWSIDIWAFFAIGEVGCATPAARAVAPSSRPKLTSPLDRAKTNWRREDVLVNAAFPVDSVKLVTCILFLRSCFLVLNVQLRDFGMILFLCMPDAHACSQNHGSNACLAKYFKFDAALIRQRWYEALRKKAA